jgi:hypothetical protein
MSDVEQMIQDCENRESKMSDWEQKFIDSIDAQLGRGSSLSPKQVETLENIWERVT